jgi:hypothetical protein
VFAPSAAAFHLRELDSENSVSHRLSVCSCLQLDWYGNCSFIGTGLSVITRSSQGSFTGLGETLAETESEQRVLASILNPQPFVGPAHTLASGDKPIQDEPSRVNEQLKGHARVMQENQATRAYGGDEENIAVPFLLDGTINLKTGEVNATKTHYRYVYNHISYEGGIYARTGTGSAAEQEMPISILSRFVEAPNAQPLKDITMCLNCGFARAVMRLRPHTLPVERTLAASLPVSVVETSSASSSPNSSVPSAAASARMTSEEFDRLTTPAPFPPLEPETAFTLGHPPWLEPVAPPQPSVEPILIDLTRPIPQKKSLGEAPMRRKSKCNVWKKFKAVFRSGSSNTVTVIVIQPEPITKQA